MDDIKNIMVSALGTEIISIVSKIALQLFTKTISKSTAHE